MGKNRYPNSSKWYHLAAIVIVISFFFPYMVSGKAPKIFILDPDEDDVVSGLVEIKVSAYDNTGVEKVECFIDSNHILGDQNSDPEYEALWSCHWDTADHVDGTYIIQAKATDTSGKTADYSISVRVKNDLEKNSSPIAIISYSSEGYKYYFYPYECYDPDGFITKYQYTISKMNEGETYADIETYSCFPGCNPPDPSSGFCLFYNCPYVCYEFPEPPDDLTTEIYQVELIVWDDENAQSDLVSETIAINASGSDIYMYVQSIVSKRKITKSATTYYLYVTVLNDSNENGTHDPDDMPVNDVLVGMEIYKDNDVDPNGSFDAKDKDFQMDMGKTTDRNGVALFVIRGLVPGDYQAQVVQLLDQDTERNLGYNPNLDGTTNPLDITVWQ